MMVIACKKVMERRIENLRIINPLLVCEGNIIELVFNYEKDKCET